MLRKRSRNFLQNFLKNGKWANTKTKKERDIEAMDGKMKHLKKLWNKEQIFAALAIDQRGALRKMLTKAKGEEARFPTLISSIGTPNSTNFNKRSGSRAIINNR